MTGLALEVVLALKGISALTVWDRLYSSHRHYLDAAGEVGFDGAHCLAREVAERLKQGGQPHFGLAWADCRLDYGHVANSDLSLVGIDGSVQGEQDAEAWLAPFLADETFRHARLYDSEYEFWQNAADPLQYEVRSRSYEGLSLRSNGFPPPLEQMVIDTSRNPGRRLLRSGFVEGVGCPIWLGEAFWPLTGARREGICAQNWLRCESRPGGVVRLRAADAPFTTAEGRSGELQVHLRSLLYPQSDRHSRPGVAARS
jgi:hypothetical protein